MTKEEYNNWKNNNPQEWQIVYDSLFELFVVSAKGKKHDDYMYRQISTENQKEISPMVVLLWQYYVKTIVLMI